MITFSNVTKQFGDNPPSLENISFEVDKGEFIFLTGPSGSGKTTLLKLLIKEYTPNEGDVLFEGESLNKLSGSKVHHHRRKIGVVFQDYRLLPELNVWENIALALQIIGRPQSEIEERVTDLLELVQLTDKAFFFPAELSGGESQRVGIARALSTAPGVLLADEPTGNLDPHTTLMIAKLFSKIHELGTTILFATHDLSILSTFQHRRIHLEKGQLITDSGKDPESKKSVKTEPAAQKSEKPTSSAAGTKVHTDPETTKEVAQEEPSKESEKPAHSRRLKLPHFSFKLPFGRKKAAAPEVSEAESGEPDEPETKAAQGAQEKKETSSAMEKPKKAKDDNQQMTEMLVQIEDL